MTTSNRQTERIPIGGLVRDADTDRVGRVADYWPDSPAAEPSLVYLSRPGSSTTWTARPAALEALDEVRKGERL